MLLRQISSITRRGADLQKSFMIMTLALFVGGCGFQPLYGDPTAFGGDELSANVVDELNQISVQISVGEDRDGRGSGLVGFEARNQLIDLLGTASEGASKYTLRVRLRGVRRGLAVQSDASVTRFNYLLRGRYQLLDNASGQNLLSGQTRAFSAYNVVDSEFATVTARRDAESRAARNIAEDVKLQLAIYFKSDGAWSPTLDRRVEDEEDSQGYQKGNPRVSDEDVLGTPSPETEDTPDTQ